MKKRSILTRKALNQRIKADVTTVDNLTYSPLGQEVLKQLGQAIRLHPEINGYQGLRAGAILAAAKSGPEGWTLLDAMREFPSSSIDIEVSQFIALRKQLTGYLEYTQRAVKALQTQAADVAAQQKIDPTTLVNLSKPGSSKFRQERINISRADVRDTRKGLTVNYDFPVNLYVPEDLTQPAPIVMISHGFGQNIQDSSFLAEHLASYGFVVVVPEHVGSTSAYRSDFLQGKLNTLFSPIDFISRAEEISLLIDHLERLATNDPTWKARLNLNQIGVYGYSLGSSTALLLAGAEINYARLLENCNFQQPVLNASLYLQCRARFLPPRNNNLRDPRIKAVVVSNALSSALFGPEGMRQIKIPLLSISGSKDIVAPTIAEQIHPFTWLTTPQKYLALLSPGDHWTTQAPSSDDGAQSLFKSLVGPHQTTGSNYNRRLNVAFFQAYLRDLPEYLPYLTASYNQAISQDQPLQLSLIQSLSPKTLVAAWGGGTPPLPISPQPVDAPSANRQKAVMDEIRQTGLLKVALRRDAPPFGYINSQGKRDGYCGDFVVRLREHLAKKLKRELGIELVEFPSTLSNRFSLVQEGTVHLECGPNTVRRDIVGVYFSKPIYIASATFLTPRSNATRVNPNRDLAGVRVGVLSQTTTEQFVKQAYPKAQRIPFSGFDAHRQALAALNQGQIDTLANDDVLSIAAVKQQNLPLENYALLPERPLTCEFYGLILPNDDAQWQKTVNDFIASDANKAIGKKWFSQDETRSLQQLRYCFNR